MPPGGSTIPYENNLKDVHNRFWCYYAENAQRDRIWAGPYNVYVPADGSPFNHCYKVGNINSRIIGMQLFDVGDNDNYTMSLFHLDTGVHPV